MPFNKIEMADKFRLLLTAISVAAILLYQPSAYSAEPSSDYPWIRTQPSSLTLDQCKLAMKHDSNFWWSNGKCHIKFIRYAAGVAIEPIQAIENPSVGRNRGEILSYITQYRPQEDLYCEKGGYCWPSKNIKLLGSILTGPLSEYKLGDASDNWQSVGSTCELILADQVNIIKFNATELFNRCH